MLRDVQAFTPLVESKRPKIAIEKSSFQVKGTTSLLKQWRDSFVFHMNNNPEANGGGYLFMNCQ